MGNRANLEAVIRERWRVEQDGYLALGKHLADEINLAVKSNGLDGEYLIRIPVAPRLKDDDKLIEKALYRKKYENAYEGVTDKVGVRIVVLTEEDVNTAEALVLKMPGIKHNKTKDYKEDRIKDPKSFGYQGLHYELSLEEQQEIDGSKVPSSYICELQIRTLLQHAVSELSHDLTYKSPFESQPNLERIVTSCTSAAEILSEQFSKASAVVKEQIKRLDKITTALLEEYGKIFHAQPKLNFEFQQHVLDGLSPIISLYASEDVLLAEVREFVSLNSDGLRAVVDDRREEFLYKQPIIILLFYLAYVHSNGLIRNWPYDREYLEPLFDNIGSQMPEVY
jgi:putative GTP pyrophosphokinase